MTNGVFVSESPAMAAVIQTVEKVSSMDLSLLIVGEQGTGKEWIARHIHETSSRARKPFWAVDCDSNSPENIEKEIFGYEAISRDGLVISRGAFEEAQGGTLLLNHFESLEASLQKKIARALEYKTLHRVGGEEVVSIDVRIIATLRQQADRLGRNGNQIEDVFSRISPIVIELPPLRKRTEDIPLLIQKFITEMQVHRQTTVGGISAEALGLCLRHQWPGNIRNLRNAIEYASVMCTGTLIQPQDLPDYLAPHQTKKASSAARIS